MSDSNPQLPAKNDEQTPLRNPYHAPVLRMHGPLSRLTQSGAGTKSEGASGMIGML
jgi:hypothetical protein